MKTVHDRLRRALVALAPTALCLVAPVLAADPPAAPEPAELKTLRMEYQQRLIKAQTPADDWYRMQLRTLLARYKQTGNLDAAVTAQAEMENPDPTKPVPADKPLPPDLAGIRSTYVINAQRLTRPVEGWYKQQLEFLERSLVQRGNIAGAQAVRTALGVRVSSFQPAASTPSVVGSAEWVTPFGGKFKGDLRSAELKGPGTGYGDAKMAMAFMQSDLEKEFAVSGRFRVTGNSGGLALGKDDKDCITIYWSRGNSHVVRHDGRERTVLDRPALAWKPESWQDFEIHRSSNELIVKVDKSAASIRIPKGIGRWRFGLMTGYDPASIEVKNLEFSTTQSGVKP